MAQAKLVIILAAVVASMLMPPSLVSAQRLPPHAFLGAASIDRSPASNGTVVTAWIDSDEVASTTVSDGRYSLNVSQGDMNYAGKMVTFKVGGHDAGTTARWISGSVEQLDLDGKSRPSSSPEAIFAEEIAAGNLVGVWHFSNAERKWYFFNPHPGSADANTLRKINARDVIWVYIKEETVFQGQILYPPWSIIALQ